MNTTGAASGCGAGRRWGAIPAAVTLLLCGRCQFEVGGLPKPPRCGDGVIDVGEQCEGDDLGGQTCASLGRGEGPLSCSAFCRLDVSGCRAGEGCGDGILSPLVEECDDGNRVACDGCSPTCTVERCGNGIVECDEACDDGNDASDDACVGCRAATCGDGHLWAGVERCDGAAVPGTCEAEGYGGGTLGCAPGCQAYDYSGCIAGDGGACADASQCAGGACLAEADLGWPGGLCSRACDLETPCPAESVCLPLGPGRFCVPRCQVSADCRSGYLCALDPFEANDLVCRPRCEADAQCPGTGACNAWQGRCGIPVAPEDGDTGAPCGAAMPPCRGDCWAGQPGGYCVSPCALSTGFCPGDGVCADVGDGAWGDYGYCLDGCATGTDCPREGYGCVTSPYGAGLVCLPL